MGVDAASLRRRRLVATGLAEPDADGPADVVRRLGAVQAQEYEAARWSLGQRSAGDDDAAVEAALAEGRVLRTHALRPTWHFLHPDDLRSVLAATAPGVQRINGTMYRRTGLDDDLRRRCADLVGEALVGGNALTRAELADVLARAGVVAQGMRLAYVLMHAELEGVVCSGPRRGRTHTYALVDERTPPRPVPSREEAVADLVERYVTSHGPATARDVQWWSSLSLREIGAALDSAGDRLVHEVVDDHDLWFAADERTRAAGPRAHLLQGYDEYFSYGPTKRLVAPPDGSSAPRTTALHALVLDGVLAGHWRRTDRGRGAVEVAVELYAPLSDHDLDAAREASERYGSFLGRSVALTTSVMAH